MKVEDYDKELNLIVRDEKEAEGRVRQLKERLDYLKMREEDFKK